MNFAKPARRFGASRLALATISLSLFTSAVAQTSDEEEDEDVVFDEIVVKGVAYGAARAIQQQKESDTIVTIVSEETLETIPEQSMGEALSRLPGVSIQRDRGEAQAITIRGADARLNAVSMNGDRLPSPESTLASGGFRGARSASLNSVPATLISQIEVWKAVPPNQDADSIGGAVNIQTKTATQLDAPFIEFTGRYGYNDLNEGDLLSGEITWGTRLGQSGNWGVIGTLSWEEDERGISGLQAEWDTVDRLLDLPNCTDPDDEDTCFVDLAEEGNVIETYDVIWRGFTRTRQGLNLTFDYRAGNNLVKFGGWLSEFEDDELRRRLQMRPGASAEFTTDTVFNDDNVAVSGATDGGRIRRRTREGTNERSAYNYFVEGEHALLPDFDFNWRLSRSFSDTAVNRTRARFEARGCDIDLCFDQVPDWTFTGGTDRVVRFTQPAWSQDLDILAVGRRGDFQQWRNENSDDEIDSIRLDFAKRLELANGSDLEIEFGYKGRFRERDTNYSIFFFDGVSSDPVFMSQVIGPDDPNIAWQPFDYDMGLWNDAFTMDDYFRDNPGQFDSDGDNTEESYDVEEEINAAYLMATLRSGRWTTVFGARFEDTSADIVASDGTIVKNDYDNVLPAVITRFQIDDNQIVRAAWTNSLSRPDFDDLRPLFNGEFDWQNEMGEMEGELFIEGGNPDLQPFESVNFDLSYEYYTDTNGVISVGAFYKEIENFEFLERFEETDVNLSTLPDFLGDIADQAIAEAREDDDTIPADLSTLTRFNFTRPVNGDTAEILGFEFNFQQQFTMLPSPWDGFGIFANYTTVEGDSDVTTGVTRDFVIGQFEDASNFQVFYETESFTARLAYNRSGVTYRTIGLGLDDGELVDNPDDDLGIDIEETWDLAMQYRRPIGEGLLTIFFDIQNLTEEDSRNFFLGSESLRRFTELEFRGRSYNLGVRWSQ